MHGPTGRPRTGNRIRSGARLGGVTTSTEIDETLTDAGDLGRVLARAGADEGLRDEIFDTLRRAEARAEDPEVFRDDVRWPVVLALLGAAGVHRVRLSNGLVFEVGPDSRIDRAVLLSPEAHPEHVWEPQTTKLVRALTATGGSAVVGGAYIGDHALPLADALRHHDPDALVHAFEPMESAVGRLRRNAELSGVGNLTVHRLALWDVSGIELNLTGPPALASTILGSEASERSEVVRSITIDDYVSSHGIDRVGIVMLDTEGGEERALAGAASLLARPLPHAPTLVFEVHREYVDWSRGLDSTGIVRSLTDLGYRVMAIRDVHGTLSMRGRAIEVVPVDRVYLEGPPHGFNLLATKEHGLVERLGLRIVPDVSPKLLLHKDPALHHPMDGF